MGRKLFATFVALTMFGAGACSSDDDGDAVDNDTTAAPSDDIATPEELAEDEAEMEDDIEAEDETSEASEEPGDCSNEVEVVNAAAEELDGLEDGPVDVAMVIADKGPHPANTVDDDQSLEFAISGFEIEADPQFGLGIPVGVPDVPDDTFYASISLYNPDGAVAEGQTYIDQLVYEDDPTAADGEINFYSVYWGSDRLLPGDVQVEITSLTDEMVCGTLTSTTDTSLQTFVGIEGSFAAERIQYLEETADAE